MKFILALSTLVAAAMASTTGAGTVTAAALSPEQSCLGACAAGDVNCQAVCVGVPHPGETQMNAATDCVAQCDQGDGSTAASDAYAKCRDTCISSYIITSGTASPTPGGTGAASGSASTTGSGTQIPTEIFTILVPFPSDIARKLGITGNVTLEAPAYATAGNWNMTRWTILRPFQSTATVARPVVSLPKTRLPVITSKTRFFGNASGSASGSAKATGSGAASSSSNGAGIATVQYGGGLAGLMLGAIALL